MKYFIWSSRYTVGRGWVWIKERDVYDDTAQDWLNIFRSDEPDVTFVLSDRKPPADKRMPPKIKL